MLGSDRPMSNRTVCTAAGPAPQWAQLQLLRPWQRTLKMQLIAAQICSSTCRYIRFQRPSMITILPYSFHLRILKKDHSRRDLHEYTAAGVRGRHAVDNIASNKHWLSTQCWPTCHLPSGAFGAQPMMSIGCVSDSSLVSFACILSSEEGKRVR